MLSEDSYSPKAGTVWQGGRIEASIGFCIELLIGAKYDSGTTMMPPQPINCSR
ncbi:MAG: hypothetical protein ACQCN4_02110 [Candidatus Bathyarchaeia archaeon]